MDELEKYRSKYIEMFKNSGMYYTDEEMNNFEITDFGFKGYFEKIGLGVVVYISTKRVSAKEVAMLPGQICPEHRHPNFPGSLGKEETFRCRNGEVYLYVEGEPAANIKGKIPEEFKSDFTVFKEIILKQGDQYTLKEDTWHWFQAGPNGAILSEFSTWNRDSGDIFRYEKAKHDSNDGK